MPYLFGLLKIELKSHPMFPIKKFWLFTSFFLLTLFYPLIINAQKSDNAQKIIEDWLAKEKKYKRYLKTQ